MQRIWFGISTAILTAGLALAQSNNTASPPADSVPAPQPQQQASQPQMPAGQGATPSASNSSSEASAHAGPAPRIAPGSVIPVSLTKTVDAKKAKVGDEVVAKVTQDMKSNSGDVIVAKDTKMMGRVTEAQSRNKEQKESEVAIAFDRAVMKDGTSISMPMSIQAVIGPQNNNPQGNQNSGSSGTQPAAPSSNAGSGRSGMGGSNAAPSASAPPDSPSEPQGTAGTRPPITANTQGVVGISDLTLASSTPNAGQGSLLTSDKNNVKIESGTMLLLRVNQ